MSHGISPIFLLLMLPYFGQGDILLPETNRTLLEANRTTDYIERGNDVCIQCTCHIILLYIVHGCFSQPILSTRHHIYELFFRQSSCYRGQPIGNIALLGSYLQGHSQPVHQLIWWRQSSEGKMGRTSPLHINGQQLLCNGGQSPSHIHQQGRIHSSCNTTRWQCK